MAARMFVDAAAFRQSLEERLARIAEARDLPVNSLRLRLLIERPLARLFGQPDSPWLVKGGYAMELRFRPHARTTKDLDVSFATVPGASALEERLALVREAMQTSAATDLGDFLAFRIEQPSRLIESAPQGGGRFPVVVSLAGREYGRFHVDVALGPPPQGKPEQLVCDDLLAFAGLAPAVVLAVPREVQFAEKVHAYARPWADRINTRTKDFVDLLLLVHGGLPDVPRLAQALRETFAAHARQPVPRALPAPPTAWTSDFATMAEDARLPERDLDSGFRTLSAFWIANGLDEIGGATA